MNFRPPRFKRISISILLAIMLMVGILPNLPVQAQSETVIQLAVPVFWRNIISEDFVNDFEAQYGVQVHLVYTEDEDNSQEIETYLDAGEEYVSQADVVFLSGGGAVTPYRTRAGHFLDLAPLIASDASLDLNDFIPSLLESYQWDAGVWGLPVSADVILMTYDPVAFDNAGLAYPTATWTIDDFANAARTLAQIDTAGEVTVPGFTVSSFGDNFELFVRSLLGHGLYDESTLPNAPSFSDPALEYILTTWQALEEEGVIGSGFGENVDQIPLRIEPSFGLSGFNPESTATRSGALLPGNTAGVDVQGFAVSAGTRYPELAYELVKYLTTRPEVTNNFFGITPSRYSMIGAEVEPSDDGGPSISIARGGGGITPENQAIVDEALNAALPFSEMRFTEHLSVALQKMTDESLDAHTALQEVEADIVGYLAIADNRRSTVTIIVADPPAPVELAPGEVALKFGTASQFIAIGPGGGMPNQERWDEISQNFTASDPEVGLVEVEQAMGANLEELAEQYDCFTLTYNAVSGNADLSNILSIDPFLDTDLNFSRNDVIGNTLAQLQRDNKTWALPIGIQAEVLRYDVNLFNNAGVPVPEGGWTVDEFADALESLSFSLGDTAPFVSNDPGGTYLLMLIAAYGGLPVDYSTAPPTINLTDPANVDAIRQVLDLAKNGYIEYQELGGGAFVIRIGGDPEGEETPIAISTDSLSPFNFRGPQDPNNPTEDTTAITTYPRGTTYNPVSYNTVTGYISANAENPEACYRWLSEVARHPELYSAMPARTSLLSDPAVTASQGPDVVAVYNELATLINDPNTIIFPQAFRQNGSPADFATEFWMKRAFDRYVLEDADLLAELEFAQQATNDYLSCVAALPPFDPGTTDPNYFQDYFGQINTCATATDPTFPAAPIGIN